MNAYARLRCLPPGCIGVRRGFADFDAFPLGGFVARDTWSGMLDAPDFMPQGSTRVHNTIAHAPTLSIACRDTLAGCADIGIAHDDASAPARS